VAADISACSGGRARSCSKTVKAERSSAMVSGGLAGTMAPSSAQRLVRSRRLKASGASTMPKGAAWKTSMAPRVSMISMVPQVSTMLERVLDEMDGRCWLLFFLAPPLVGGNWI